jgi:hypothetical protein
VKIPQRESCHKRAFCSLLGLLLGGLGNIFIGWFLGEWLLGLFFPTRGSRLVFLGKSFDWQLLYINLAKGST